MARRYSPDTILSDGEQIARVWAENPNFTLGDITLALLQSKLTQIKQESDQLETLRTQITALTNSVNAHTVEAADMITRARSGFRAFYGPDSTQYEQAGGTRRSERKRPKPRASSKSTT